MPARTLFEKLWESHVVEEEPSGQALLYVDLHLVHEVTSPQAFEGLRRAGRRVRRPDLTVATIDHNVPTEPGLLTPDRIADPVSRRQVEALAANCREFGVPLFGLESPDRGIVHVIGPELGLTQPGKLIVCGDSHTATHGAFGALAFGIGTSEVEHVLATQTLWQRRPRTMEVRLEGRLAPGVTPKDLILAFIGRHGPRVGQGYAIEFTGPVVEAMTMEERMTLCNMAIEAGARVGLVAPDETTFAYLRGRRFAPQGRAREEALSHWRALRSDPGARYDRSLTFDASGVAPQVTWGTHPGMTVAVTEAVPDPRSLEDPVERAAAERALAYMGLEPGTPAESIRVDRVFIGSCTNARLEDLRAAAAVARGRRVAPGVRAMVVPGSEGVRRRAEAEGLDRVFLEAGFEWRASGCSLCLGMNPDVLRPGERAASTSNRNFEGRQGRGGRTHLVSPAMAAAAAVAGHFVDVRRWLDGGESGRAATAAREAGA